jgi:putative ABC transport system permease protein
MSAHASFWEAVVGAIQSLGASKLRSFLTLLGIILATTTLIAVISVISGMEVYIAQNVSDMGADGYRVTRHRDDAMRPQEVSRNAPTQSPVESGRVRFSAYSCENDARSRHVGGEVRERPQRQCKWGYFFAARSAS